jgi:hypothetical protein
MWLLPFFAIIGWIIGAVIMTVNDTCAGALTYMLSVGYACVLCLIVLPYMAESVAASITGVLLGVVAIALGACSEAILYKITHG